MFFVLDANLIEKRYIRPNNLYLMEFLILEGPNPLIKTYKVLLMDLLLILKANTAKILQ